MAIWVLTEGTYEDKEVVGVYPTLAEAKAAITNSKSADVKPFDFPGSLAEVELVQDEKTVSCDRESAKLACEDFKDYWGNSKTKSFYFYAIPGGYELKWGREANKKYFCYIQE
mgnify:CR=1 FL=1